MEDYNFFKHYLPALELSINDETLEQFDTKGPDWYIEDGELAKEMSEFEEIYYEDYKKLFDMVALFLDCRSHGFPPDKLTLVELKKNILSEIEKYKSLYLE